MPRSFRSNVSKASPVTRLDVRADDTDARDYLFEPSLRLLPEVLDPRSRFVPVIRDQGRDGACVGFALAAVINASLAGRLALSAGGRDGSPRRRPAPLSDSHAASEQMLYEMARRYDEWRGESYEGTSLRGAMKGWHKHGVTTREAWPWNPTRAGRLDAARAEDARRRPLGAYYRVIDSDVAHVQAAIAEGDAVLASLWVHRGWAANRLEMRQKGGALDIRRIPFAPGALGLHAVALIGYAPEGFVVQNSWGGAWGTGGLAILAYEDWMENRQDAWVARPGPQTWDVDGRPQIFLDAFKGGGDGADGHAGSSASGSLEVVRESLPFLVNTGDKGDLSTGGRLETRRETIPAMAAQVHLAQSHRGFREIVLYAHGGLVSESGGVETAGRLWSLCRSKGLTAWFFVWETGMKESLLGMLRSQDDAAGPRAGFDFGDIRDQLAEKAKKAMRESQRLAGRAVAGIFRDGWSEMKGRAAGASQPEGGASLFAAALLDAMRHAPPGDPFRIHLFGHSAGSIYLAALYQRFLKAQLAAAGAPATLGTIQFFAPAISVSDAKAAFAPAGVLPVPSADFRVHTLSDDDEEYDNIIIYPSSILTYVAELIEGRNRRVPLLGIRQDLKKALGALGSPTWVKATDSVRHGGFDDEGHEVEKALAALGS